MSSSAISGFTGAPVAGAADAQPPQWKTWHSDADLDDRRQLIHEMCVAHAPPRRARASGQCSAVHARCGCSLRALRVV
jgi:hypothetical protein